MSLLDHLLVKKYKKRGILVEVSFPCYVEDKFLNLVSKLRQNEETLGSKVVLVRPVASGQFLITECETEEKKELDEEEIQGLGTVPVLTLSTNEANFLNQIKNIWEITEEIKTHLKSGKTVIVSGYVFDALLFGYSNDCFSVRKQMDKISIGWLLQFFKGLIQPDLILSVIDNPSSLEAEFRTIVKNTNKGGEEFDFNKEIIYSKMYQTEDARDLMNRAIDSVRPISPDAISFGVHGMGSIIATAYQREMSSIKFY